MCMAERTLKRARKQALKVLRRLFHILFTPGSTPYLDRNRWPWISHEWSRTIDFPQRVMDGMYAHVSNSYPPYKIRLHQFNCWTFSSWKENQRKVIFRSKRTTDIRRFLLVLLAKSARFLRQLFYLFSRFTLVQFLIGSGKKNSSSYGISVA